MKQFLNNLTFFFIFIKFILAEVNIELLRKQISSLSKNLPDNHNYFAYDLNTQGEFKIEKFSLNELDNKINELGFSEFLKNKFRGLIFAKSLTFQSFSMVISSSIGSLEEVVGYAQKNNQEIDLVFIHTKTTGKLLEQSEIIFENPCSYILGIKIYCYYTYILIPRGYLTWEINIIDDTLRSHSYEYLKNKLNETPKLMYLADTTSSYPNKNVMNTDNIVNTNHFKKALDNILIEFHTNIYIIQLKGLIDPIFRSISIHNFEIKNEQEGKIITQFYCTTLQLSLRDNCETWFNQIFKINFSKVSKEQPKSIFRIGLLSNFKLEFVQILITYYEDNINNETYFEIEMKYLKQTINSTKNLTLLKSGNDEDYYEMFSNKKIENDEKTLLNLFEILFQLRDEFQLFDKLIVNNSTVDSFLHDKSILK